MKLVLVLMCLICAFLGGRMSAPQATVVSATVADTVSDTERELKLARLRLSRVMRDLGDTPGLRAALGHAGVTPAKRGE